MPFTPEARQRAQEILNRRSVDDPATLCLPQPTPRMTPVALFPVQIVQTPQQVVMLYEYFWQFRVIPMGGKQPTTSSPLTWATPSAAGTGHAGRGDGRVQARLVVRQRPRHQRSP
jgi:hypothetical protein